MSEPEDVWEWDRTVDFLLRDNDTAPPPQFLAEVVRSKSLQDAMSGFRGSLDDAISAIMNIHMFLTGIAITRDGEPSDPNDLARVISKIRSDRKSAVEHLSSAAEILGEPFHSQIAKIAREVAAASSPNRQMEYFEFWMDPSKLGRRGRAALNAQSATTGWYIKTLDSLIPTSAQNRYAAIAGLLKLTGVHTTPANVRGVIVAAAPKK